MSEWLVVLVITTCNPHGKCVTDRTVVDRTTQEDCLERMQRAEKGFESEAWQELIRERKAVVSVQCRPAAEA